MYLKTSNKLLFNSIKPHFSFEAQTTKLKLFYFGHTVLWYPKHIDKSEKRIMLGTVESKKKL